MRQRTSGEPQHQKPWSSHGVVVQSLSHVRLFATLWAVAQESSVHGILQARILEWALVPSSRGPSEPRDHLFPLPSLYPLAGGFFTTSATRSLLIFMPIESVMLSSRLTLCPPLLLSSILPSIRVFPDESAPHIRWPKYWSSPNREGQASLSALRKDNHPALFNCLLTGNYQWARRLIPSLNSCHCERSFSLHRYLKRASAQEVGRWDGAKGESRGEGKKGKREGRGRGMDGGRETDHRSGAETQGDSLAAPEHRQGGHHAPGGTAGMRLQRSPLQHCTLCHTDLLDATTFSAGNGKGPPGGRSPCWQSQGVGMSLVPISQVRNSESSGQREHVCP